MLKVSNVQFIYQQQITEISLKLVTENKITTVLLLEIVGFVKFLTFELYD